VEEEAIRARGLQQRKRMRQRMVRDVRQVNWAPNAIDVHDEGFRLSAPVLALALRDPCAIQVCHGRSLYIEATSDRARGPSCRCGPPAGSGPTPTGSSPADPASRTTKAKRAPRLYRTDERLPACLRRSTSIRWRLHVSQCNV